MKKSIKTIHEARDPLRGAQLWPTASRWRTFVQKPVWIPVSWIYSAFSTWFYLQKFHENNFLAIGMWFKLFLCFFTLATFFVLKAEKMSIILTFFHIDWHLLKKNRFKSIKLFYCISINCTSSINGKLK